MFYLLLALIVLAALAGPQIWVAQVLKRYNKPDKNIAGTGGQFAQHLLKQLGLSDKVKVEQSTAGDFYDPSAKTVNLGPEHFNQQSLAAITIAAHEVGHAIQDAENNSLLRKRQRLITLSLMIEKVAPIALAVTPILLAVTKSPLISALMFLIAAASIGTTSLMHFITLPVELDASFNKAMPILEKGGYFKSKKEYRASRKILQAAAMTYVAQSLFNLLNIGYWLRILRR